MIDERTCAHEHHEPVFAYVLPQKELEVGDTVQVLNDAQPVARICTDCMAQLPANWGCPDCQWFEVRRLCDPMPIVQAGVPCDVHRDTLPA